MKKNDIHLIKYIKISNGYSLNKQGPHKVSKDGNSNLSNKTQTEIH